MSYRGKKYKAQKRALDKKNLLTEMPSGTHGRGCGGIYRSNRRRQKKRLQTEEAERKKAADALLEQAEALRKEAALYRPWCPEEAQKLEDMAEKKRAEAEEVLKTAKPKPPVHRVYACPARRKVPAFGYNEPYAEPVRDPVSAALAEAIRSGERNFMEGVSYRINPVDTLKMISASSVFGEPQYYRDGSVANATIMDGLFGIDSLFARYSLQMLEPFKGMTASQVMEKAIDDALSADFGATLLWAAELREKYLMRLNPQVILVRAACHPGRNAYTEKHPGGFGKIAMRVMSRGDDVARQAQYCIAERGSKKGIPAILKRSWAERIGSMDAYAMAKYRNAGIGLVDAVRICHAKGPLVDTLMRKGSVPMPEGENTWERLRASGMSWQRILSEIHLPHMALMRNLRGIFSETRDPEIRKNVLEQLKRGVRKGKQFPFRYLSAWKAVEAAGKPWTRQVKKALEDCMTIACENLPALKGRSAFLTDNSGSAWCTCTSEWGTMQIAEIGNLSSVIGAMRSDEGVVFPFGDRLKSVRIRRDQGALNQAMRVGRIGQGCGAATENGIWLFFRDAILHRQHWDNIFVYSDMQAGHGGLYGTCPADYEAIGACVNGMYIDVNMLVKLYREQVNPRVNVFCIQTAGYTNVLVPEYGYRTAILYGWTGRELLFADAMNRAWNELEQRGPEER